MRADDRIRPSPHDCCLSAMLMLFTVSSGGSWKWRLAKSPFLGFAVAFCPWCGEKLPESK